MADKISDVFDANPTAGSDPAKDFNVPLDFGEGTAEAYNKKQLADAISVDLDIPDSGGNPALPVINSFTAIMEPDTLVADLVWSIGSSVTITGWIVKEDDTTLPSDSDSGWKTTEPATETVANYNAHTLTARIRYLVDSVYVVSTPVTITVQGTETAGTEPVVDSFTTVNPIAGSSTFSFTLDASNATYYKFIYNSNTPPLAGDSGWTAETFSSPLESTATLDDFEDSVVYAYVRDATSVSPAVTSFVDVTISGDKSGSDWLWENNPASIVAYGTTGTISFSGSGSLVIDGTSSDEGVIDGSDGIRTGNGVDNASPLISIAGTYTSIEIINIDIKNGRGALIQIDGTNFPSGTAISIRNNKLGSSNINGEATNLFKTALVFRNCENTVNTIYGNYIDGPDGFIYLDLVNGADFKVRHNWCSGMQLTTTAATPNFVRLTNFFTGRWGFITGDITENIIYDPDTAPSVTGLHDTCNLWVTNGTSSVPFLVTRNRFYARQTTNAATFQIGDNSDNAYTTVDENTVIGSNALGQFSSGNNHKVINNKCYTPKSVPAIGAGFAFQIQRQGITAGKMHSCTIENNTSLFFYDAEDGSPVEERDIYYPSYGRESDGTQSWPNHGECVGTCDIGDNVSPTGLSNNEWSYQPWSDGQGVSELWRASWDSFSYSGSDGLTPTINYDSPWIGDGGSQSFSASSVTSAAFGDGAEIDDVQTHDVLSLAVGGTSPYTISSVTAVTNCSASNNVTGVIFTAGGSGGAFTYEYTLQDNTGLQATGTVSGTIASASSERNYYDENDTGYVSITFATDTIPQTPTGTEDPNFESFSRDGNAWNSQNGSTAPNNQYMQHNPYGVLVSDVADVETLSAEIVCYANFKTAGTYTLYVCAAAEAINYDSCWGGYDNTPNAERFDVAVYTDPIAESDWNWDDGDRGAGTVTIVTTGANEKHTIHVWTREGGLMLGKIVAADLGRVSAPTGAGPAESAIVKY